MELVRFSPFGRALGLGNQMNSILGDFFGPALNGEAVSGRSWNPVVDIYETEKDIVVKAEAPGVDKKDIAVDINDGVLTVKGERKNTEEVKEDKFYRKERVYGKFQRSFHLPEGTDYDKINADFKDGILTVTIPKAETRKSKRITVH